MKYRTIIEIENDGFDEDDAINSAGEYLRGNIDYAGISLKCRTAPVGNYDFRKIGITGIIILITVTVLLLKGSILEGEEKFTSSKQNLLYSQNISSRPLNN